MSNGHIDINALNSKESEMMVLGCMFSNINGLNIAAEALNDSDFYFPEHKTIFQALKTAYQSNKPADVHLICEELKRLRKLKSVGGSAYIVALAQYAGTSVYIEAYVEELKEKSLLRSLISKSQEIQKQALDNPNNSAYLIEKFQNDLKYLEQRQGKKIPIIFPNEHLEKQQQFLDKHRAGLLTNRRASPKRFVKNVENVRQF